jgi:Kef-type K+ transport system membrane component KefB
MFIGVNPHGHVGQHHGETLKELGKLDTPRAAPFLGAALIDDVMGIIALTMSTQLRRRQREHCAGAFEDLLFFVFTGIVATILQSFDARDQQKRQRSAPGT